MDRDGYRELLRARKLSEEKIEPAVAMAERFEAYLTSQGEKSDAASAADFCRILIQENQNTFDNLLALARYGRFIRNNAIYVAFVELLDGAEVQPNLYQKVGSLFGEAIRDEAFAGIGISILGLPNTQKPYDLFPVLDRLVSLVGNEQVKLLLSACLRDLPDESYLQEGEKYRQSAGIDDYLRIKHQDLVKELEKCQQEGQLFFTLEVTPEVVEYVRQNPETECGVRQGNILYVTKIPYDAKKYLAETDPRLKRFYACHCPWVRQGIRNPGLHMDPVFCHCSGGFSKKPWEVIFGQVLRVEVLESALRGDLRCRFAVYLPEGVPAEG